MIVNLTPQQVVALDSALDCGGVFDIIAALPPDAQPLFIDAWVRRWVPVAAVDNETVGGD